MLAPILAVLVLVGYVTSIWWLLRRESARTLLAVLALTAISVGLRLLYLGQYPSGLNEDEVKVLWCGIDFLRSGRLFVDDCSDTPGLMTILFPAQLATLIGPSRWAIRGLSFLGATLAVPAAFGAARSFGLRVAPSLAAAGFVASLPWALFFGRVHQAGEIFFEAVLVGAFLARLVGRRGGVLDAVLGGFALTLLLQTYYSGRTLAGLSVVALVLAPGRYRLYCLGLMLVAAAGFYPYYMSGSYFSRVGLGGGTFIQPGMAEDPLRVLQQKATLALGALVTPTADDRWVTVRAAAVHPVWILGLGAVGFVVALARNLRTGLLLLAGFLGGIAPAVVGYGQFPSARRMLTGMPFLSLAAAHALDLLPWAKVRAVTCALVLLVTGAVSARFYFSSDFWHPGSLWVFDAERWNLVESLPAPPHPRLIVTRDLGYYNGARVAVYGTGEVLTVDNWFPKEPAIYAFGPEFGNLQSHYLAIFGPERVRTFGRAFSVNADAGDWSRLQRYGWFYEARCEQQARTGQVPFLLGRGVQFKDFDCVSGWQNTWRGRWLGPTTKLRLYGRGTAAIEVDGARVWENKGWDVVGEAEVRTGSQLTVRVDSPPTVHTVAELVRTTAEGEEAPPLEWVEPVAPPTAAQGGS